MTLGKKVPTCVIVPFNLTCFCAHEEQNVASLPPCGFDMLGLFLEVFWRGHYPAKDPDLLCQDLSVHKFIHEPVNLVSKKLIFAKLAYHKLSDESRI